MTNRFLLICSVLGLLSLALAFADEEVPVISPLKGGTSLFGSGEELRFQLRGGPDFGSMELIRVTGVPFSQAVEMQTLKQPPKSWNLQLGIKIPAAIKKGDVIWFSVWMRAPKTSNESGEGISQLCFDTPSTRWEIYGLDAPVQWKQFATAFIAPADAPADSIDVTFRGGFRPQVIQLGGFQMIDYGTTLALTNLPHSKITYKGMEPDAAWRKVAADRIEKYRKADVRVEVKDASGQPLAGATVKIELQRHAFGFGSCVTPEHILGTGPDDERYRQFIKDNFSKVVFENSLKWGAWEKGAADGHKTTLDAMHWLLDNGIEIRGHNLVWPSFRFMAPSASQFKTDKDGLENHIEAHIVDEVGGVKGLVTDWDVVNEPYGQHTVMDMLGDDVIAKWIKVAHATDPKTILCINDYAGFLNHGEDTSQKDYFEKILLMMKHDGAPIGGLGIESHFGSQLTGPEQIMKELDRWAALGLDIEITEFDVDVPDEEAQGQYTRDFMTAVFSNPSVTTLLTWGFWEGADWIPDAALFRKDWSIKPNGRAWIDLVKKQWHTNVTADTDASGSVSTRGFMGQYLVTVTYHGATKTWPLKLPKEGATLAASMP